MLARAAICVLMILLAALVAVCWLAGQVVGAFRRDHGGSGRWYEP
jgi:hypothetical protein